MKNYCFILFVVMLRFTSASSQDLKNQNGLYQYAVKSFKDGKLDDALSVFKNLLKQDSSNINYLYYTSFLYSKVGYLQKTEELKQQWFHEAEYLGLKAIAIDANSGEAHYVYALSLGRMNEHASNKVKISNAKIIKSEAETAIRLNPDLSGPYHILGKWNQIAAGFNILEKTMIKILFGGIPLGTYDDAIKNFRKAISVEEGHSITYYELALSYYERNKPGDRQQSLLWVNKAIQLPVRNEDDRFVLEDCNDLLKKLQKK